MKIFCYLQFLFERKYTENTIEYNIFILMNSPDYTIMQKKNIYHSCRDFPTHLSGMSSMSYN